MNKEVIYKIDSIIKKEICINDLNISGFERSELFKIILTKVKDNYKDFNFFVNFFIDEYETFDKKQQIVSLILKIHSKKKKINKNQIMRFICNEKLIENKDMFNSFLGKNKSKFEITDIAMVSLVLNKKENFNMVHYARNNIIFSPEEIDKADSMLNLLSIFVNKIRNNKEQDSLLNDIFLRIYSEDTYCLAKNQGDYLGEMDLKTHRRREIFENRIILGSEVLKRSFTYVPINSYDLKEECKILKMNIDKKFNVDINIIILEEIMKQIKYFICGSVKHLFSTFMLLERIIKDIFIGIENKDFASKIHSEDIFSSFSVQCLSAIFDNNKSELNDNSIPGFSFKNNFCHAKLLRNENYAKITSNYSFIICPIIVDLYK